MAHNEPVEHAQTITGKTTVKQLLDVVRQGRDSLFLTGYAPSTRASWSDAFVFTMRATKKGKDRTETTSTIDLPGWVSNGQTSTRKEHQRDGESKSTWGDKWVTYDEAFRPLRGSWFLSYNETLKNVLQLLPRNAEVSLHVYLDAGTNEYLIRSSCPMNFGTEEGLHSDQLYLLAEWAKRGKKQTMKFLISVSTGPHNSARFGCPRWANDQKGSG